MELGDLARKAERSGAPVGRSHHKMARNEEKAQAMLNRWIEQKQMMEDGKGMSALASHTPACIASGT